jgi:hypothetical protein
MKEYNDPTLPPSSPGDLFQDLSKLSVNQDFDELTTQTDYVYIPLRKPNRQCFIRTSPKEEHRVQLAMLEIDAGTGGDRQLFIVLPSILPDVADLPGLSQRIVILGVARPENTPFLWPLKTPNEKNGKKDSWGRSALEIARLATDKWIRVTPSLSMGCYVPTIATAKWPEPQWPDLAMNELLRRAVGEKGVIQDLHHPAIRALRGEI